MSFATKTNNSSILKWLANSLYYYENPVLGQTIDGLYFPNPIGMAAGFDKNGLILQALEAVGFGFVEVGSISAQSSKGNAKPRVFRLPEDEALINRMGLNNDGADVICERLKKHRCSIPLGVNVAKTHSPEILGDKAIEDYNYSFKKASEVADYITLNISCPNTTEGKTFEDPIALTELLESLLKDGRPIGQPVYVKLSVDLNLSMLEKLVAICLDYNVHGFVATNTSGARENLTASPSKLTEIGRGGLSGQPIKEKSTAIIRRISKLTEGKKTLIGVGGIMNEMDALEKIKAGAHLIQVYTGMIYKGPAMVKNINRFLAHQLDVMKSTDLTELKNQFL